MKKFFYALFLLCLPLMAQAEFVNKNVTMQNIPIEEAINHFHEWFSVGESTFVLFNDETDDLGYRELDYRQYANGIPVEGCALYVHGSNGYATIINGDIMPKEPIIAHLTKAKKIAKVIDTNLSNSSHCFVKVKKNNAEQWFEVIKEQDGLQMIYRDVYTGEIVMTLPMYMSSTACNVTTLYSGEQTIDCEINEDNQYVLRDDTRHIQVQRAKMSWGNPLKPYKSYDYTNNTTDWNDNYLTSFTITSINSDTWWKNPFLTNDKPDLYIVIYDELGNLLYVSDIKKTIGGFSALNRYNFPVTFHISKLIPLYANQTYTIKIYDSDADENLSGDDDLGYTLSINVPTIAEGLYQWGEAIRTMQGTLEISKSAAAFDVLWGLGRVVDFYSETFNHNSFDRNGSLVKAYIGSANGIGLSKMGNGQNYEISVLPNGVFFNQYDNAFALATTNVEDEFMHFGMGCIGNPQVGLNTIAHEFTHMVTNFRPKGMLTYQGESGALSEGFSDIFAMCVDNYVYGNVDWKFDEESQILGVGALRDIANPHLSLEGGGHPTVYEDFNNGWIDPNDTTNDKGGVHCNSTILSHWFYILTEGKTGVNTIGNAYSVNGIGIEKAQRIAYRMLMTYLSPNSDFVEARTWAIQSAQDFVDAGLYEFTYDDVIAVANAWYAVGVGEEYVDNTLHSGKYFVIAVDSDALWFMSSDLTSTSTKRLVADTLAQKDELYWIHNDPKFVWNVTRTDELNYTIENNGNYLSWTSGNSATMSTTPKEFGIYPLGDEEGTYAVQLDIPNAEPRFLSYNTANGSHYYAFYQNTNQQYALHFVEVVEYDSVTIRAKMPTSWGETISCWVWYDGYSGEWKTPTKNGDWYEYSGIEGFNIIFVNGTTWDGDNNQTVDIMAVSEDVCIQLGANASGKRNYIQVDCPEPEPTPEPEPEPTENDYLILAKRNSGNYYYLTPDKVSGKDRLIAVDAGAAERSKLDSANAPLDYVWTVEETATGYLLKSATNQYIACNAAKTVTLAAEGTELQKRDNSDGTATFYYAASETETRYLSLAQNTYDYFVFYVNENQFTHLLLVTREGPATAVEQARNEPVAPQKLLRNGQVIIVRGGVEYNLMGQPL